MSKFLTNQWNQAAEEMDSFFQGMDQRIAKAQGNKYVFLTKFSNISRPVQSLPIEARTYAEAVKVVKSWNNVENYELLSVFACNCWHDGQNPEQWEA